MDVNVPRAGVGTLTAKRLGAASDERLIELLATGEVLAFEALFDRHASPAFSLAYRICRSQAAAEEIVQGAFTSVWRNHARFSPSRGSVRSWLLGIVHHRAIDCVRRTATRDRRHVPDERVAERIPAPELTDAEVIRRDEAHRSRAAVNGLPPEQRQVVELAYFDGFTHRQIAHLLQLPEGTVKGRMRLALTRLGLALAAPAGSGSDAHGKRLTRSGA